MSASAHADRAVTTVALAAGVLDLEVAPRDGAPPIQVEGGRYRFQVLGARFRVARTEARAELEVRNGTVAVVTGERVIARVRGGERWAGPLLLASSGARAAREAAGAARDGGDVAAPAHETAGPDCLALARDGLPRRAVDCFARIAEGTGLSAEMALYEIARLRRDVLGDPAGAAAALEQYRRQFPRGSLRTEAEVSLLELLPRLGRADEALADSERLLATAPGRERAPELRLLRGNIYRELLRDFGRAEAEYAPVAADRGATGDEAAFQRAVCLQSLGRLAEAREAFARYLERPNPRHAAEAARLARLR